MVMRNILITAILLLVSCKQTTSNDLHIINEQDEVSENSKNEMQNKWVQYKKVSSTDTNDIIPTKDSYLLIDSNTVSVYTNNKLSEKHHLIRDKKNIYPSYYFEDKPDDFLIYLDEQGKRIVIKRDNFDGVQEYYIKEN